MPSLACTEMDRDKEREKHKNIKHLTRLIKLEKSCGNTKYIGETSYMFLLHSFRISSVFGSRNGGV